MEASANAAKGQTKKIAEESGGAPLAEGTPQDNQTGALEHRDQKSREGQQQGKNGH